MNKKETKKVAAKTNVKKAVKKAPAKKVVSTPEKKVTKPVETKAVETVNLNECRYCHNHFEKGLTICPTCRRSQKDKTGPIVISVLTLILLLCIIGNHFIEKYYETTLDETEYKYNCTLVSYEDLVRNPKNFKNKEVKIIGTVVSVAGEDWGYGNNMIVTVDANLFSGSSEQLINFEYLDRDYEIGLIEGDVVTIYGEYKYINGNIPYVEAKYIVFGS